MEGGTWGHPLASEVQGKVNEGAVLMRTDAARPKGFSSSVR